MQHHRSVWLFPLLLSWVVFGCGTTMATPAMQEGPAEAPMSEPGAYEADEEASDLGSLEADLNRNEQELRSLLASGEAPMDSPPAAEPSPPLAPMTGASQPRHEPSRCERVCRAMQSMDRSAEGICRMITEGDERCLRARERVGEAKQLIHGAGCSCLR